MFWKKNEIQFVNVRNLRILLQITELGKYFVKERNFVVVLLRTSQNFTELFRPGFENTDLG